MKQLDKKLVFTILIAGMFCLCVIMAIEGQANFFHMLVGFVVCFGVAFALFYMRFAPIVIGATIVMILGGYFAIKFEWVGAVYGAIAGILTVVLMQFGWVGPHMKDTHDHHDYVKKQREILEQEKDTSKSYAEQMKEQHEKEKAEKAAKAKEEEAGGKKEA